MTDKEKKDILIDFLKERHIEAKKKGEIKILEINDELIKMRTEDGELYETTWEGLIYNLASRMLNLMMN